MNSLLILSVQCSMSLLTFFLIFKWYLVPKISKQNKFNVLSFLLLINVFRYLPLSLFMPGQVDSNFPLPLKETIAHGDFLSGILALLALILIKTNQKSSIVFVWIFSIVSTLDIVIVMTLALHSKVYNLALGANYFTVSVYVPLLIVVQTLIFKILIHKSYK